MATDEKESVSEKKSYPFTVLIRVESKVQADSREEAERVMKSEYRRRIREDPVDPAILAGEVSLEGLTAHEPED